MSIKNNRKSKNKRKKKLEITKVACAIMAAGILMSGIGVGYAESKPICDFTTGLFNEKAEVSDVLNSKLEIDTDKGNLKSSIYDRVIGDLYPVGMPVSITSDAKVWTSADFIGNEEKALTPKYPSIMDIDRQISYIILNRPGFDSNFYGFTTKEAVYKMIRYGLEVNGYGLANMYGKGEGNYLKEDIIPDNSQTESAGVGRILEKTIEF